MGLKSSLDEILKNIERAKRNTFTKKDVILVAATKTRSFNQINQVYSLGIRHIGENRIQEAEGKFESFEEMPKITRRFIGHLQSNKINKFIKLFDTIDSIDSYRLANKINTRIEQRKLTGLIEVNTSGDKNKNGFKPELSDELIQCLYLNNLNINGLMTLGPFSQDPKETVSYTHLTLPTKRIV